MFVCWLCRQLLIVSLRHVTCVRWIPYTSDSVYDHREFSTDKLLCCNNDGRLLCIDVQGRLYAAASLNITVLCLDSDGSSIFGGCNDGTIRVWILDSGVVKEIYRQVQAHDSQVTAIKVHREANIVVSAGSDGTIRIWKINQQ